jgi:alkanesulfonate monooxygenase SsuD/methylene tetrahydromethanopterin reductase-like flavin-dependent oxidoreductase (luciferase family)
MKFGMFLPQREIGHDFQNVIDFVGVTENAGFDFLQATDHVLGADTATRPHWDGAYDLNDLFHEQLVLFGYLAAITDLELVTAVLILPQRQTALVAKQAAQIDIVSGGRFRLGVGVGWNAVEYEALGIDFYTAFIESTAPVSCLVPSSDRFRSGSAVGRRHVSSLA